MMASLEERLDQLEAAIKKPTFRQNKGKANEVNYWVFDYPPEKELEVRERIAYLRNKNTKGTYGFELVVFDLYDIIMDHLESKNFVSKCKDFEGKKGISYVATTIQRTLKITDKDNLIVQTISVDEATTLKRAQFGSRGRVSRINKRRSHLNLELKVK